VKKTLKVGLTKSVPSSNLFPLLEECFSVTFVQGQVGEKDCEAHILAWQDMDKAHPLLAANHTYIIHCQYGRPTRPGASDIPVYFSNSRYTPGPFRNRTLINSFPSKPSPMTPSAGHEIISSIEGGCTWAIGHNRGYYHYEVGSAFPVIPEDEPLFKSFKGHNFIGLLPLVDFLRNITGLSEYRKPRQTACIMIDDPNLHSTRYGYIGFKEIAEHARSNNYHVAFAAIPLDLCYANKKAVNIFHNSPERLSLLIHGNNHLSNELGSDYDHLERISLVSHALARVQHFERKTGLRISRVMAAPHGTCSASMLEAMAECGIEGGAISFGSLYKANRQAGWGPIMGLAPSTIIAGLPVFNRIHLSMDYTNEIFLAAYLNQPIIPNGHHWDLKDHFETLRAQVDVINSMADVHWGSMHDIARMNYLYRTEGEEIKVKALSRRIVLTVPQGIRQLSIEESDLFLPERPLGCLISTNEGEFTGPPSGGSLSVNPGDRLSILFTYKNSIDPSRIPIPPTPIKAVLRRIMTESKDRLRPYSDRFVLRFKRQSS
jgi:hypothetical protein